MAALLEYYGGAVTWTDYEAMPHRDLQALQSRMLKRLRSRDDGEA